MLFLWVLGLRLRLAGFGRACLVVCCGWGFGHFGVLLRLCCVLGLLDSDSLGFVGVA